MKYVIFSVLFFIIFSVQSIRAQQDSTLKVATYNIRVITFADRGVHAWHNRKAGVSGLINSAGFDVFGVQEVANKQQERNLRSMLPAYSYFGKGRDSERGAHGEQVGVFYKTERFTVRESGFFFLSQTPTKLSKGWDANFRRICVWVKLYDKINGSEFYFFSSHFDHVGIVARQESAKLVVRQIAQLTGNLPAFFVGDLNNSPNQSNMYQILSNSLLDARLACKSAPEGQIGTFNGFDLTTSSFLPEVRIDYIFCKKINVLKYRVITDIYLGKTYPSDHFPVMIDCKISN